MSNIASYFQVKSKTLQKHYKHQVSGYHEWEQKHHFIDERGRIGRNKRWESGDSFTDLSARSIPSLAETLCRKAREYSLDSSLDSPFALLAKENDIMWSGGMPDDCTVLAMHVVGKPSNAL